MKDINGILEDSNNYRGIGLGCLILKIIDWVVRLLNEKELESDENDFGFQEKSSTTICTWTAVEVVNSFKNTGANVCESILDYR